MTEVALKIPSDLEPFLADSVKTGAFTDAGDFLVNLLYNIRAQSGTDLSEEQQAKLTALRAEIGLGVSQADSGDFMEFSAEDILAEGRLRRTAQAAV